MVAGLAVSDAVKVDIQMSPVAVPVRNFGALAIIGDSNVIDIVTRVRQYSTLNQVAADFGVNAPEYKAADLFFSQEPQPALLYIGRFAHTATEGQVNGGILSPTQQGTLLTTLQGITNGSLTISIDGVAHTPTAMNFSAIANLNGAAAILQAAIPGTSIVWDSVQGRFVVYSTTTGTSSSVSYASDPGGVLAPLATDLALTQAAGAMTVPGQGVESPTAAVAAVCQANSDIYGVMFALSSAMVDADCLNVAAYIEGASPSHIFGWTTQESAALDPANVSDIGSLLKAAGYKRTFWQYSSSSPYATASTFGRAFTVDFTAQNSTITLKFKQEPGITAEVLTETQAAAIKAKNGNVFVEYMNDTAIIQEGVMANGYFFDEVHGTDWLQNNAQTRVWNLLYQSPTKIPQTDAGAHQIATVLEQACDDAVNNGLVAPGIWNSPMTFGQLTSGMTLTKGYYVYMPPVASQSQTDREARKAPTAQVAIKLAGAVHFANVVINVNR